MGRYLDRFVLTSYNLRPLGNADTTAIIGRFATK